MKDYYEILGVSREADPKTIKVAYKSLIKKYHPDINKQPGAEEKFKEIKKAYEVLSDEQKRIQYDQYGESAFETNNSGFGGFNQDFYRQTVNSRIVKLKEMKWYSKILMILLIIVIVIGAVLFFIISAIVGLIINLINMLFSGKK